MTLISYVLTVFIWGFTWIAMKHQLGLVPVELSIAYRFGLASIIIFTILFFTKKLSFIPIKHQPYVFIQSIGLFSGNFIFIYLASEYIPSGIVSVVFSAATLFNMAHAFLIYHRVPTRRMVFGACLGLVGMVFLFWNVFTDSSLSEGAYKGILFALVGTWIFSLGNMAAARNSGNNLPLLSVNAWGMLYATFIMLLIAFFRGVEFTFDTSTSYVSALIYLAIPASVIGYTTYLHVVKKLGPERAAYITVLFPVVALTVSFFLEGYDFTFNSISGFLLIISGNILVLLKK